MKVRSILVALLAGLTAAANAQESLTGLSVPTTVAGGGFFTERTDVPDAFDSPWSGGIRGVAYPTLRINKNWYVGSAIQVATKSFFYENFDEAEYKPRVDVLQGFVAYERYAGRKMLRIKAGQMSTAFGSYLLEYDDARNPVIDIPAGYGYYYSPVSTLGLAGAQLDAVADKWDIRLQATTSSPANRRSLSDSDQYLNWTGGAGYTIRQGFRVGVSAYHGPYLHREHRFFRPGELNPKDLPADGYGIDVQFARGHLDVSGEFQYHRLPYTRIPTLERHVGYIQARYAFRPRWFVAARWGGESSIRPISYRVGEAIVGYRPNRRQIVKAGYELLRSEDYRGASGGVIGVQLVTQFNAFERAF